MGLRLLVVVLALCFACSSSTFGTGSVAGPLGFEVVYAGVSYHAPGGTPTFQHVTILLADHDLSFRCDPAWDGGPPPFQFSYAFLDLLSHDTDPGPRKYTFSLPSVTKTMGPAELVVLKYLQGAYASVVAEAVSGEVACTQLDATGISCTFSAGMVQKGDGGTSALSGDFTPKLCSYLPEYP